jgi:hypothetical protein
MKKVSLTLGVFILIFSACSVLSPAEPTSTPVPPPVLTPTPDPCSKENILAEAEKIQMYVNEFREVTELASITSVSVVVIPVIRLQEIRYEIINTKVPQCLDSFKSSTITYTASVINSMMAFMSVKDPNNIQKEEADAIDNSLKNSQTQWQVLLNEFNKILAIAGIQTQAVPETSSIIPTPTGIGATATNEGTSTVNVRAKPTSDAIVVASIEKGMQAEVIGRNEAGDWLNVKVKDLTGWVFAELIKVSIPVDQLPVVELIP